MAHPPEKFVRRAALYGGLGQLVPFTVFHLFVEGKIPSSLFALSVGVAGSAVWWAVFASYAEQRGQVVLAQALLDQRRAIDNEAKNRATRAEKGIPTQVYAKQSGFDRRLWRDLMRDLDRSDTYGFLGVSGVWVAARVKHREAGRPELSEVTLVLIDPRATQAMKDAAGERRRKEQHRRTTEQQAIQGIRRDLQISIVALFDVRGQVGRIRVYFAAEFLHERTDLFDDAAYDGNVSDPGSANFPQTARWDRHQPEYRKREESLAAKAIPDCIEFRADSDESDLIRELDRIGLGDPDLAHLRYLYKMNYSTVVDTELPAARRFSDYEYAKGR